jgi:uncharacterized membrane protein YeaQ/YmgE (transglycosylase-associated protein family)
MLNILSAIVTGLVIGVLGVGGSLLAGLVTSRGKAEFNRAGCLASILGAMVLIFVGHLIGWR